MNDEQNEFLDKNSKDTATICSMIDADNADQIWESVAKHFPDYEIRFIEECAPDEKPGARFVDFENKTKLTA